MTFDKLIKVKSRHPTKLGGISIYTVFKFNQVTTVMYVNRCEIIETDTIYGSSNVANKFACFQSTGSGVPTFKRNCGQHKLKIEQQISHEISVEVVFIPR